MDRDTGVDVIRGQGHKDGRDRRSRTQGLESVTQGVVAEEEKDAGIAPLTQAHAHTHTHT
eukprot:1158344-Pelagomonas_calceolata.AAC.16